MSLREQIDTARLPRHIAVIMDGNGRWAQQRGEERIFGHRHGVQSVDDVTEAAVELGIGYLTLYAFSTENWNRPKEEVDALMELLVDTIEKQTPKLNRNNVRLLMIGDRERLSEYSRLKLQACIDSTAANTGMSLVLAISYSARWELTKAMRDIAKMASYGGVKPEDIDEQFVSQQLTTRMIPDPDLLIRTSGELRISNFLLWQIAYAELYFTDVCWPDFGKEEFYKAVLDYQHRERRYGKTTEQIHHQ